MGGDPEYRRFQFGIADLLAVITIIAVLGGLSRLPASLSHFIPLFAILYVVKYRILTLRVQPWLGLLLYFLVVAALLPYLYCRVLLPYLYSSVMREWDGPLAIWVGVPIAVFAVPTASLFSLTRLHRGGHPRGVLPYCNHRSKS